MQKHWIHASLLIAVGALSACSSTPKTSQAATSASPPSMVTAPTAPAVIAPAPAASPALASIPDAGRWKGYYSQRADVQQLALGIAQRQNLDINWVMSMIDQARFLPQVPRLMLPAGKGTAKNWQVYRSRFIDPIRIRAGQRFWQEHAETLARAEKQYGVPAQIIVGIIGVETIYGQNMGNLRVLDSLSTLAFDFPTAHPRAADRTRYFQGELEQFLALSQRNGVDPTTPRGSYAGAMGLGQFMPSSWARFAVDFDGDGKIDLFNSPVDAIGSVANYFVAHGWKTGMATHYPVRFDSSKLDLPTLLAPDIVPTFTAEQMQAKGVILNAAGQQHAGLMALVELENGGAPETLIAGTENFYAITRYNWSSYYALAVIELGQEVAEAMNRPVSKVSKSAR